MPEAINLYSKWLGIETRELPPNHYELLQIAPFEADLQVISVAAAAQMARIRKIRPGAQAADWQRILDELAAAKNCLCDPQAKARYDDAVRKWKVQPATSDVNTIPAEKNDPSMKSSKDRGARPTGNDDVQAGKNLLPPSKSGICKPEAKPVATPSEQPATTLNPMPPTRASKPSAPATPLPMAIPLVPSPSAPIPPAPAAFPSTATPGAPIPGAAPLPQPLPFGPTGIVNRPMPVPGSPTAPHIFPTPIAPWGAGGPMPGQAMPTMPQVGFPNRFPTAAPIVSAKPATTPTAHVVPAGNQFFDELMHEDAASPLDELGLGGERPARPHGSEQSAASNTVSADGELFGAPPSRRTKRIPAQRNSSPLVLFGAGVVVAIGIVVGAMLVVNSNRHRQDALADTSSGSSTSDGGTTTSTIATPNTNASIPPVKANDPSKSSVPSHDSTVAKPPKSDPAHPKPVTDPPRSAPSTPQPRPQAVNPTKQPTPALNPPTPMPVDPAQAAKLRQALATARVKLGERNAEEAKALIATASQLAVTHDQHDMVDRMDSLEKYVDGFWAAVRDALKSLKTTDEIDVDTTKVIVVEASADALTIHIGGSNRRFQVKQLPSGLAVALAVRWLDPNKPENKVYVGAFYLVDPKTGPEYAKQAWDEAAAAGVDVKNLLPLLQPDAPETRTSETDTAQLAIVPEPTALDKAEAKVHEEMEKVFADATSAVRKFELAKKLIAEAESSQDPARRYVMWREARDLAADAGQPAIMVQAVDHLAKQFRIDPLDMKAEALTNFPAKSSAAAKAFNEASLKLVDEALTAKRQGLADRFVQIALEAAKASKSAELVRKTQQRAKEFQDTPSGAAPAGS